MSHHEHVLVRHSTIARNGRLASGLKVRSAVRRAGAAVVETLEQRALLSVSLGSPINVSFGSNETLGSFAAGDINGDGITDLVVSDISNSGIELDRTLIGSATGFSIGSIINLPSSLVNGKPVMLADLNFDGILDVVQGMQTSDNAHGQDVVELGNGNGTFFNPGLPSTIGTTPLSIVAGDVDNDRIPDVVTSTAAPSIVPMFGLGDGTFRTNAEFAASRPSQTIALADFNGDGNLDLATPFGLQIGKGDGSFNTPIAYPAGNGSQNVVVADLNNDNKPDIILAGGDSQPLQPADITILLNNGDGTFTASTASLGTGLTGIVSLAVGDIDGDGSKDLIATIGAGGGANANSVAVLTGHNNGTFDAPQFFATGAGVGPVLSGQFTGSGKSDIAVLDTTNAQILLFPNTRVLNVTTTVASSALTAVQGEVVQFTATVVGTLSTKPTGTVTFFDGATQLGSSPLGPTGIATFVTTQLAPGAHTITSTYSGDSNYGSLTAAPITQTINAPSGAAVDVQVGQLVLAPLAVPGDKGTIHLVVTNHGTAPAAGRVAVQLFASTNGAIDSSSISLPVASLASKAIKLTPGKISKLTGKFTLPLTMPVGTYQILARLSPITGVTAGDLSSGFGPSSAVQVVTEFGTVGGRKNVKLVQPSSDGGLVTYSMSGPGTGTVAGGGATVTFDSTTTASKVKMTKKGGDGIVSVGSVTSNGSLGSFGSAKVVVSAALTINGGLGQLTLGNVSNAAISITAAAATKATFGNVTTTTLTTTGVLTSLKVESWTGNNPGKIIASSIGTLSSKGEFDAGVSLHGAGLDLRSATFGGSNGGLWGVAGNIGKVTDKGAWSNGGILGGTDFGADNARAGGDDKFIAASIASLNINGAVTQCFFAAGLDPVDAIYLNGNDVLTAGSTIGSVNISGTLGTESRILAAALPRQVQIGSQIVNPATDPRFKPA